MNAPEKAPGTSPLRRERRRALDVVLVMPAYNEEACVEDAVRRWGTELSRTFGERFRVLVVDDGSTDDTGATLERMAREYAWLEVVRQPNAGHGAAVVRGYTEALALDPEYVFQTDSDNQFQPRDFALLWAERHRSRFILGHRAERHDDPHRLVITRILRTLLAATFARTVPDANVPFRLMQSDYLGRLLAAIPAETFAPNIFLSMRAANDREDLMSIPVSHVGRKTGRIVMVRWRLVRACARTARELVGFRLGIDDALEAIRDDGAAPAARNVRTTGAM